MVWGSWDTFRIRGAGTRRQGDRGSIDGDDKDPPPPGVDWAALTTDGWVRTWPHRHGMDGFFAARLRKVAP